MTQTSRTAAAHSSRASNRAKHLPDDIEPGQQPASHPPAAGEIGAAMAHELSGPMTALLLYVGEIQQSAARAGDESMMTVVEGVCREAEQIHALVLKIGGAFEPAISEEAAINSARNAIAWWKRAKLVDGEPKPGTSGQSDTERSHSSERSLTRREQQVLRLIILGHSNKEGAALMKISYRTFESHRAEIMRKFGAKNAAELVRLVMQSEVTTSSSLEQPVP